MISKIRSRWFEFNYDHPNMVNALAVLLLVLEILYLTFCTYMLWQVVVMSTLLALLFIYLLTYQAVLQYVLWVSEDYLYRYTRNNMAAVFFSVWKLF